MTTNQAAPASSPQAPVTTALVREIFTAQGREIDEAHVAKVVDVATRAQAVAVRLQQAGDRMLQAASVLATDSPQLAPAERAVARVVEQIEVLLLVCQSVTTLVFEPDDAEVVGAIDMGDAIANRVLAAA
ncbi:hypothetical protein [Cupriavidus sp. TMH.W2]|uniref:hypothetical protein n=1 Tax=Cupriavidus sp. TMH.W2 TaxID=3434465 RepID=UPI003D77E589